MNTPAFLYLHLTQLSVTLFARALFPSLEDIHRNTVRWECSFWELHLQLQVTWWFSTLGAVALFEETSKRVKWFFNLDHSIGPCEACAPTLARQSSLEIDIACVYCPDRTLLLLECHFLGQTGLWQLNFGRLANLVSAARFASMQAFPLFALVCLLSICIFLLHWSLLAFQASPDYDASRSVHALPFALFRRLSWDLCPTCILSCLTLQVEGIHLGQSAPASTRGLHMQLIKA